MYLNSRHKHLFPSLEISYAPTFPKRLEKRFVRAWRPTLALLFVLISFAPLLIGQNGSDSDKLKLTIDLVDGTRKHIAPTTIIQSEIISRYGDPVVKASFSGPSHTFLLPFHGNGAADVTVKVSTPDFLPTKQTLPKDIRANEQYAWLMLFPKRSQIDIPKGAHLRNGASVMGAAPSEAQLQQFETLRSSHPTYIANVMSTLEILSHTSVCNGTLAMSGIEHVDWEASISDSQFTVITRDTTVPACWRASTARFFKEGVADAWDYSGNDYFVRWHTVRESDNASLRVVLQAMPFSYATYESLWRESAMAGGGYAPDFQISPRTELSAWEAIEDDNLEQLKIRVASGFPIDSRNSAQQTLLGFSLELNKPTVADYLLQVGADPNKCDPTCLVLAAEKGSGDLVKLLVAKGASIVDKTALAVAIKSKYVDVVRFLLANAATPSNEDVTTAIKVGAPTILQLLLNAGAALPKGKDEELLSTAAQTGSAEMVALLVHAGLDAKEGKGEPLGAATGTGDLATVQALIEHGANPDLGGSHGPPLLSAALKGFESIAAALLSAHARTDIHDDLGFTPLMYASLFGSTESVKHLLEQNAEVNTSDPDGLTPLMLAAIDGSPEDIAMLLAKGANKGSKCKGKTALDYAKGFHNQEAIAMLEAKKLPQTLHRDFTLVELGRRPEQIRRELLDSLIFIDLPLLAAENKDSSPLRIDPQMQDRLASELDYLLRAVKTMLSQHRSQLEAETGHAIDKGFDVQLQVVDTGFAGAQTSLGFDDKGKPQYPAVITVDAKLLRANLRAGIQAGFPEYGDMSIEDEVSHLLDLRRQIRSYVYLTGMTVKNNGAAAFSGNMADFSRFSGYMDLIDQDAKIKPLELQYYGTLLFMIAHEIGHVALGHLLTTVSNCKEGQQRELDADKFAANLLGESLLRLSIKPSVPISIIAGPFVSKKTLLYLDEETLNRFSGFAIFFGKGYEYAHFTDDPECAYPAAPDRLAVTRSTLSGIRKLKGDRVLSALQKKKDWVTFVKQSFVTQLGLN